MARNGSGVYSKPVGTTAVTGTTISSSDFNTLIDDIVADLNLARPVTHGGTGASNANDALTNLGFSTLAKNLVVSGNTAAARIVLSAAPIPTGSGVGQWQPVSFAGNTAVVCPANGTWAYFFIQRVIATGGCQAQVRVSSPVEQRLLRQTRRLTTFVCSGG